MASRTLGTMRWRPRRVLLVGHLEEQQVRELFQVVAVGEPVVAEDVAVVPEFVDDRLAVAHASPSSRFSVTTSRSARSVAISQTSRSSIVA